MRMAPSQAQGRELAALLAPVGLRGDRETLPADRDWLALFRLATAHLVAPSLHARLQAGGGLDAVPPEIRDALEALYLLNDQRNRQLRAVLQDTVRLLNRGGIVPLLLKGSIALLPDQYPHAFARVMSDLDLAVAETEIADAAALLLTAGYSSDSVLDPRQFLSSFRHHWPPLFHPEGWGYVEIHRALCGSKVPAAALPLPRVAAEARPLVWEGLHLKVPTLEHRLLHNALHYQLAHQAVRFGRCSLRQLLEFAHWRELPGGIDLDWPGILHHLDRTGCGDVVRAYLRMAHFFFGQPLPTGVGSTAGVRRAYRRYEFRQHHPRLGWWRERITLRFTDRLIALPRRLITPSWYPAKYRYLRHCWFPEKRGEAQHG